jgi:hypothetical protein
MKQLISVVFRPSGPCLTVTSRLRARIITAFWSENPFSAVFIVFTAGMVPIRELFVMMSIGTRDERYRTPRANGSSRALPFLQKSRTERQCATTYKHI